MLQGFIRPALNEVIIHIFMYMVMCRIDDIIVQSFYGFTLNKLQHKCSQLFLVQKNVLYNILKVSRNLMGGKYRKLTSTECIF